MQLRVFAEQELPDALREQLDELLGLEFASIHRWPRGRGWTHAEPALRVIAVDADDRPAGQVALVAAGRRIAATGITDLVVARGSRGRGLSTRLLEAGLRAPVATEASLVFAASARPQVRGPLIERLGFRPARPFELYWTDPGACRRNPDWIVRGHAAAPVEVVGDV